MLAWFLTRKYKLLVNPAVFKIYLSKLHSFAQELAQSLFLFNYVRIPSAFVYYYEKKILSRLLIAHFFSNAGLLFLNLSILVSPLFFNSELPVTYLMVTLSSWKQILLLITHWYKLNNKDSEDKTKYSSTILKTTTS